MFILPFFFRFALLDTHHRTGSCTEFPMQPTQSKFVCQRANFIKQMLHGWMMLFLIISMSATLDICMYQMKTSIRTVLSRTESKRLSRVAGFYRFQTCPNEPGSIDTSVYTGWFQRCTFFNKDEDVELRYMLYLRTNPFRMSIKSWSPAF